MIYIHKNKQSCFCVDVTIFDYAGIWALADVNVTYYYECYSVYDCYDIPCDQLACNFAPWTTNLPPEMEFHVNLTTLTPIEPDDNELNITKGTYTIHGNGIIEIIWEPSTIPSLVKQGTFQFS